MDSERNFANMARKDLAPRPEGFEKVHLVVVVSTTANEGEFTLTVSPGWLQRNKKATIEPRDLLNFLSEHQADFDASKVSVKGKESHANGHQSSLTFQCSDPETQAMLRNAALGGEYPITEPAKDPMSADDLRRGKFH